VARCTSSVSVPPECVKTWEFRAGGPVLHE
jgi:hypothetical protein